IVPCPPTSRYRHVCQTAYLPHALLDPAHAGVYAGGRPATPPRAHPTGAPNPAPRAVHHPAAPAGRASGPGGGVLRPATGPSQGSHPTVPRSRQPDESFSMTWITLPMIVGDALLSQRA